jgi:hypothetical protein
MKGVLNMFDVIEMMHSLNTKSYEELCKIALDEMAPILAHTSPSKVELITCIIAARTVKLSNFKSDLDKKVNDTTEERGRYIIHDTMYDRDFYVNLTESQKNFWDWCVENNIDFDYMAIHEVDSEIVWETP